MNFGNNLVTIAGSLAGNSDQNGKIQTYLLPAWRYFYHQPMHARSSDARFSGSCWGSLSHHGSQNRWHCSGL